MKLFGWLQRSMGNRDDARPAAVPNVTASNAAPLLSIDAPTLEAARRITRREHCACLAVRTKSGAPQVPVLHSNEQDVSSPGWLKTQNLIRAAKANGVSTFTPSADMPWEEWMTVVTLPKEIANLTSVTTLRLYGSHLRRLPPEIGRMTRLADLDVYTSYSLHWLPYEVMRCKGLKDSRMSTRALYGNRNTGLPFPRLRGPIASLAPDTCSVCDQPFGENNMPRLYWTTQRVGTDHVPLLVHSCSDSCTDSIPDAPSGFFARPHKGGGGVGMPTDIRR